MKYLANNMTVVYADGIFPATHSNTTDSSNNRNMASNEVFDLNQIKS